MRVERYLTMLRKRGAGGLAPVPGGMRDEDPKAAELAANGFRIG
jgi:hypothetical protein